MGEIKYGHREGPGKGREIAVTASQYFLRLGGHFVNISAAGHVQLATDAQCSSPLYGWAEVPKDAASHNGWKSSSTGGYDKVFIISGCEDKFEIPYDTTLASANATEVGNGCGLSSTNATWTMVQKGAYFATAASCNLIIHDFDKTNQTVIVSIKPGMFMQKAA